MITREEVYTYLDKMIEAKKTIDEMRVSYGEYPWETAKAYGTQHTEIMVHDLKELLEAVGLEVHTKVWEGTNYYIHYFDYTGYTFADICGNVKEEES